MPKECISKTNFHQPILQKKLERFTQNYIKNPQNRSFPRGPITIPVVVHIVYPTEAVNISDEQVGTQIDALNRDFNALNADLNQVHPDFRDRIGKVGFQFCLATTDPFGQPTNGITRTATPSTNEYFPGATWIYSTAAGGQTAWDTERYLNIWVTKMSEVSGIIGFGSKPYQNPPDQDGVIVATDYFGTTGTVQPPFDLGRTAVHEVGHYFNLFHTWAVSNSCNHDDFVSDTPSQNSAYRGCPDIDQSSCGTRDITNNYMNLSDDACLVFFTEGQALRMQAALMGARFGLLNSNGCMESINNNPQATIEVFPNPASYFFCIRTGSFPVENIPFQLFDIQGKILVRGELMSNQVQHLPTLENGIYFIEFFEAKADRVVRKLVVRK